MQHSDDNRVHKINEHTVSERQLSALSLVDDAMIYFGQSAEDAFLLRFFYQKKSGFYVDIGAYSPTRYSNTFLLHHLYGWRGLNVDASADVINEFEASRSDDINVCAAVGKPADRTYYRFSSSARNTLSKDNVTRQEARGDTKLVAEERVTVLPLSELLDNHLPPNQPIDFLDIDVEGLEMEVLESVDWAKYRPRLILVEDYAVGEGKVFDSKLYKFMTSMNYRLVSHHYDTSFYLDNSAPVERLEMIDRREFIDNLSKLESKYGGHLEYQALLREKLSMQQAIDSAQKRLRSIENSLSWRLTKPLRLVRRVIAGWR